MAVLAVIPARSGSKGFPNKNILDMCGKPMLAYSIAAALDSGVFETVHVSTDSEKYAEIARAYGADVPFLRSTSLSQDASSSWDVVREVLEKYQRQGQSFDVVCLLQPTSPLRTNADISEAYKLYRQKDAAVVVGVCEVDHSPLLCNVIEPDLCMDGFNRPEAYMARQSVAKYYRINGSIYFADVKKLFEGGFVYDECSFAYIMDPLHSVDIDAELDFLFAELIMSRHGL